MLGIQKNIYTEFEFRQAIVTCAWFRHFSVLEIYFSGQALSFKYSVWLHTIPSICFLNQNVWRAGEVKQLMQLSTNEKVSDKYLLKSNAHQYTFRKCPSSIIFSANEVPLKLKKKGRLIFWTFFGRSKIDQATAFLRLMAVYSSLCSLVFG